MSFHLPVTTYILNFSGTDSFPLNIGLSALGWIELGKEQDNRQKLVIGKALYLQNQRIYDCFGSSYETQYVQIGECTSGQQFTHMDKIVMTSVNFSQSLTLSQYNCNDSHFQLCNPKYVLQ